MKKLTKTVLFIILLAISTISVIVYRSETLLRGLKKQQVGKVYTANKIIALIKSSKEYFGDSVTIFDNGKITSSIGKFQGTLNAVIDSKDNMDLVVANINTNRLPLQYNFYILAATFYRQQYGPIKDKNN